MASSAATSKVIVHRYKATPSINLSMSKEERERWGKKTGSMTLRQIISASCAASRAERRDRVLEAQRLKADCLESWEIQEERERKEAGTVRLPFQVGEPYALAD